MLTTVSALPERAVPAARGDRRAMSLRGPHPRLLGCSVPDLPGRKPHHPLSPPFPRGRGRGKPTDSPLQESPLLGVLSALPPCPPHSANGTIPNV